MYIHVTFYYNLFVS